MTSHASTESRSRTDDHLEIIELLARYAVGIDTGDATLIESAFAPTVRRSASATGSMGELFALDPGYDGVTEVARDELGDRLSRRAAHSGAQHLITNHRIAVFGDRATVRAYYRGIMWPRGEFEGRWFEVGGEYQHDLRYDPVEGWRIAIWRINVAWQRGDASVILP